MKLEVHDSDPKGTLVATIPDIHTDHQAEAWVKDTVGDPGPEAMVKWLLIDERGLRCVWERPAGESGLPVITQRSARYLGTWQQGPNEIIIP